MNNNNLTPIQQRLLMQRRNGVATAVTTSQAIAMSNSIQADMMDIDLYYTVVNGKCISVAPNK